MRQTPETVIHAATPPPRSIPPPRLPMLEAFLVSTAVVALGELGDKTQLLALVLAARFGRPWPIVAGIFVATLANHAVAGWVGNWVRGVLSPDVLRWLLALSFFAVAAWALKPDKLDEDDAPPASHWGVFGVTVVAFFLAEMGDKTQVATVMLAAKFDALMAVVVGTTLGMLLVNVPTVFIGKAAAEKIPFRAVRIVAAALFAGLGVWVLLAPHLPG
jgi:putative Ca2+/H+ antiporter (TMEM165/GDT1 family)